MVSGASLPPDAFACPKVVLIMHEVLSRRPSRPMLRHPVILLALVVALMVTLAGPVRAGWSNSATANGSTADDQRGPTATVDTTEVGWSTHNYRRRITLETNDERVARGRVSLKWRTCLNRQAQSWADHLARTGTFRHSNLQSVLDRCNLRGVGENLALGYTNPSATIQAWMNSSGHRANMLNRSHRLTGMGMAKGSRGWVTVQLLGWQ